MMRAELIHYYTPRTHQQSQLAVTLRAREYVSFHPEIRRFLGALSFSTSASSGPDSETETDRHRRQYLLFTGACRCEL
jgi:hypothetical protein